MVYLHAKYAKPVLNDKKVTARTRFVMDAGTDLTFRSKLKVKGHQQWYTTHRLEVVYLYAKYEMPVLNDKKVTARTRFVRDAWTGLTLRSKFKGHQQWYATHRLEVVYLHVKYAKPVLNDKKVTARTWFVTDGRTDHYRASTTKFLMIFWTSRLKTNNFMNWSLAWLIGV